MSKEFQEWPCKVCGVITTHDTRPGITSTWEQLHGLRVYRKTHTCKYSSQDTIHQDRQHCSINTYEIHKSDLNGLVRELEMLRALRDQVKVLVDESSVEPRTNRS